MLGNILEKDGANRFDDVIVRDYRPDDYDEALKSGYVFSPYFLRPSIVSRTLRLFGSTDWFTLVAYHKVKRRIAGVITYLKYTDTIWVTGPLFVSPDFRRMGIGSLLTSAANALLKKTGVKRAFGDVPLDNPVVRLHSNLGMKPLVSMLHVWGALNQSSWSRRVYQDVKSREAKNLDFHRLFKVYKESVTQSWLRFFGIDESNFLCEYSQSVRAIPMIAKRHVVIEADIDEKTRGYSLVTLPRIALSGILRFAEVDIFAPSNTREVAGALIMESMERLQKWAISHLQLYFISNSPNFRCLEDLLDSLNLRRLVHFCMGYVL